MQKKVSVKDIAQELNISLSTVHKALTGKSGVSEKKREEVIETAKHMGYVVNSVAQSLARRDIKIGIVMPSKWNDYFAQMKSGMEQEFAALQKYKVQGVFCYISNDFFGEEPNRLINWIKIEQIDVLIYCPSIYSYEENFFGSIKKMGVPVFFSGDTFDNEECVSAITVDSEMSGKLAADFYRCIYPTGLRVAALTGSLKVKSHKMKIDAFQERVKSYGGEVLNVIETGDDDDETYRCMDTLCENNINAIYVSTATSLPVCRYIEERGLSEKITLVCTDLYEELKYYMKKNIVSATVCQNQEKIGRKAVRVAYEYFVGKNSYGGKMLETSPIISIKPSLYLLADVE